MHWQRTDILEIPGRSSGRAFDRRSGFTLVEMMVAIVVIGITLTAAFSTIGYGYRTMETGRDYTRVAQILQSEMEDMRTLSWSQLEPLTSTTYQKITLNADFAAVFGDRYEAWLWVRNRVDASGVVLADQKEISIKVTWKDSNGILMSRSTTTWFTENGMHDYFYRSF